MVYHGRIQNGVVVLEGKSELPEGTRVRVEPEREAAPPRGSWDAIKGFAGVWADQADDMERSLAELRDMKADEVRRQQSSRSPNCDAFPVRHEPCQRVS